MDDSGATQLLEPPATVTGMTPGGPGDGGRSRKSGAAGGHPRRWILLAVVAALLLVGIVAFALGSDDGAEKVTAVEVAVPDLRGMTLDRAGDEVAGAGLSPGTIDYATVDESVTPSGTVLSQDPVPGALVAPGTKLDIVLAQGPPGAAAVVAEVTQPAETEASSGDATDDSGAGAVGATPPPSDPPPVLPDLPPAESIDISKLQAGTVNPGVFKLLKPEYRIVVEHEGYDSGDWQSPALTFGDKPKRILIAADGPLSMPLAVWAWGPSDGDWRLKTVWFSGPGNYFSDNPESGSGTLITPFAVGAGTYTVLVRLNPDVKQWKVVIQEQK